MVNFKVNHIFDKVSSSREEGRLAGEPYRGYRDAPLDVVASVSDFCLTIEISLPQLLRCLPPPLRT